MVVSGRGRTTGVRVAAATRPAGSWLTTATAAAMAQEAWRARLVAEVPRNEIPRFLEDLQALVAELRRYREDLVVPGVEAVQPLLTPSLRAHGALMLDYLDDGRYREVVAEALVRPDDEAV